VGAAFDFLDWPGPLAFAHRGGASEVPENTLPAFEHAVGLGYRYLETDVHLTADGVLLAFHDDVLDRVTDRTGVIAELPWSVVQKARVDGREPIPRFEDLVTSFPDARINVDPKHDEAVGPLAVAIRRTGSARRICIGSFSDRRIEQVRGLVGPELCTSMGPRQIARFLLAARGLPAGPFPAPCAQIPIQLATPRFLDAAHRRGIQVHVWTVDAEGEMRRLLDLGVDGIMTDRPAVLKELLQQRDQWHE
jgi:glycerophosphoryl diester phosphodiesterase